jgi:uncharacterized protein YcnI
MALQRSPRSRGRRLVAAVALTCTLAAVAAATASAHARMSPPVSLSGEGQLYSLAVPTEKDPPVTTTKVVLTVPTGFSIDSFVASPGWTRFTKQTGSGEDAVIQTVTWTGGGVPSGEDALFQFLGEPSSSGTYTFQVEQTYSDGSIVNWTDPASGENPAPTIEAKSSLGGGGTPLVTIIALAVGVVALILALVALLRGGASGGSDGSKRQLA